MILVMAVSIGLGGSVLMDTLLMPLLIHKPITQTVSIRVADTARGSASCLWAISRTIFSVSKYQSVFFVRAPEFNDRDFFLDVDMAVHAAEDIASNFSGS